MVSSQTRDKTRGSRAFRQGLSQSREGGPMKGKNNIKDALLTVTTTDMETTMTIFQAISELARARATTDERNAMIPVDRRAIVRAIIALEPHIDSYSEGVTKGI